MSLISSSLVVEISNGSDKLTLLMAQTDNDPAFSGTEMASGKYTCPSENNKSNINSYKTHLTKNYIILDKQ